MIGKNLKRALAAAATVALAAAAVAAAAPASRDAASKRPKPPALPSGFVGQVKVEHTMDEGDGTARHSVASATFTFKRDTSRARGGKYSTSYGQKFGTMTWNATGSDSDGCTWSGTGSRAASKNEVFLQVTVAGRKVSFSAPADLQIPVAIVCPAGTTQSTQAILHPFFTLMRKVAGVGAAAKFKTIAGSSTSSASGETTISSWSFRAIE
jgi:hypothetical protein